MFDVEALDSKASIILFLCVVVLKEKVAYFIIHLQFCVEKRVGLMFLPL